MDENRKQKVNEKLEKKFPSFSSLGDTIHYLMENEPDNFGKSFKEKDITEINELIQRSDLQSHISLNQLIIERLDLSESYFPNGKQELIEMTRNQLNYKINNSNDQTREWISQYKDQMLENIKRGWNQ